MAATSLALTICLGLCDRFSQLQCVPPTLAPSSLTTGAISTLISLTFLKPMCCSSLLACIETWTSVCGDMLVLSAPCCEQNLADAALCVNERFLTRRLPTRFQKATTKEPFLLDGMRAHCAIAKATLCHTSQRGERVKIAGWCALELKPSGRHKAGNGCGISSVELVSAHTACVT